MSRYGPSAGWQAERLHGKPGRMVAVRLPHLRHALWGRPGTSDAATFDEIFMSGEYDLPFRGFRPERILDLGANIGYASVYFTARWPGVKILALEPDEANLAVLQRNVQPWGNVKALHGAVWARPGRVTVANPSADANAFRMEERAEEGGIDAYTVPQLMQRLGDGGVDLLKLDVEGAEAEILRQGSDWLGRVKVLVVELHDRMVPGCGEALRDALAGRRFRQEVMGGNLAFDFRT